MRAWNGQRLSDFETNTLREKFLLFVWKEVILIFQVWTNDVFTFYNLFCRQLGLNLNLKINSWEKATKLPCRSGKKWVEMQYVIKFTYIIGKIILNNSYIIQKEFYQRFSPSFVLYLPHTTYVQRTLSQKPSVQDGLASMKSGAS